MTSLSSLRLPDGFPDVFTSRLVEVNGLRLHAVTGGVGPALMLIGGWPQTWYAWREVMPALARRHTVVAVDSRGTGLSDKPDDGYDAGTLAADLVALMAALGHDRFDVVGHDIGTWTGYALAADRPERVGRLAIVEAVIPGLTPSPPFFGPDAVNLKLWQFGFNRLTGLNEELVRGRERLFFGWQFATKAATRTAIPAYAVDVYVDAIAADPRALRASFAYYRALDETIAQNEQRSRTPLTLPVLALGGALWSGASAAQTMRLAADDVTGVVLDDCGHYPAEEQPARFVEILEDFLTANR
ncbi:MULTISPECIES: alpha/beta fold hydrolase [Streptomyces]|uniref:Pimeloyl-ACP methyl ester carboxylesterase n=3 Tax=Streptomyces stelliscabiei TaxID=146820 RepID=A0A8I0TWM2_9ACTN|nr:MULTISPECIES: alpha/beta hydrolase [Streptomyces]MBE1602974.1 pimeloyl-ACP methyl ester carboxylesterase [Streptomyces stelliscabiei]MDX2521699.1 alpha/beta hydrolase [Streptomyces stelliscabiei]